MGRSTLSTTVQLSTPVSAAVQSHHRHAPTRSSSLRQSTVARATAASSTPPPAATTGTGESASAVDSVRTTTAALSTPKPAETSTSSTSTPRTSRPSIKPKEASVSTVDTTSKSRPPTRPSTTKSKSKAKAHSQSQPHLLELESSPNAVALPPPPRRVGRHGVPFLPPYTPIDTRCAFCGGTKARNRANRAEELVGCYECGSSGHPTCLDWDDTRIVKRVKQYAWLCQECKRCEVCDEKGDDADMLFCDSCDRGWHRACQTPPMTSFPRGKWVCPTCKAQAEFADDAPTVVADGAQRKIHVVPPKLPLPSSMALMALDGMPKSERSQRLRRSSSVARGDSVWDDGSWSRATYSAGGGGGGGSRRHSTTGASVRKDRKSKGKGKGDDATPSRGFYDPFADNDLVGPRVILPGNNKKRRRDEADWMQQVAYLQRMDELEAEQEAANADPIEHVDLWAGYLRPDQSDTKGRTPNDDDRRRFKRARDEVEARQLRILLAPRPAPVPTLPPAVLPPLQFGTPSHHSPSHFSQMPALNVPDVAYSGVQPVRSHHPPGHDHPGTPIPGMAAIAQSDFDELTIANGIPIANIRAIRFGEFEIETWYQAPFPEEYSRVADGRLWICEFCLKYTKGGFQASRHRLKCKTRHPPGDEIYRDGSVSVFEVDGRKNKMYCQNLCLLAKMFLDHKTLYYDVEPFLFYVMTTAEVTGAKFVGYFSKEKRSPTNNVSCIMTLPVRQRRGWGNLLIDFSYLLSKKEGRVGTPERPLSELGLLSYRNYWTLTVCQFLNAIPEAQTVTIQDISEKTAMTPDDIYFVLKEQGWIVETSRLPSPELIPASTGAEGESAEGAASQLQRRKSRVGGGAGGSLFTGSKPSSSRQGYVDDPHLLPTVKVPEHYRLIWDRQHVAQHVQKWERKNHLRLKPDKLQWSPFLVTRGFGLDANVGSTAKDGTAQIRPNGDTNASPARTTINVGALANGLGAQWDDDSGSSNDPREANAVAGPSNASRSLATSALINGAPRAMAKAAAMDSSKATSEADAQCRMDEDEDEEDEDEHGGEASSAADSTFQAEKEEEEEEEEEEDEDRARINDNFSSDESGPSPQVAASAPRRPKRGARGSESVKVPERRELRSRASTVAAPAPLDGTKRLTRQSLSAANLATPSKVKTPKGSSVVKTNGHQRKVSTSTTASRREPSSSPRTTRKGLTSREVKISPELGRSTIASRKRREVSTLSARTSEGTAGDGVIEETPDNAMAVAPSRNGKTRSGKEKVGGKKEDTTMTMTYVDESEEENSDEDGDDDVVAGMVGLHN